MEQLQDREQFSQRLDRIITEQGIIQTELARASGLHDSQINALKKGADTTRISKTPVLKCIEGLIRLHVITTVDEIKIWLRCYFTQRRANHLPVRKLSIKEGKKLVQLLKQVQEQEQAEREQALKKPIYLTRWQRIHLIGREQAIQDIKTKLQKVTEDGTRFLTLVGVPGVGKSELAWQVLIQEQTQENFLTPDPISLDRVTDANDVKKKIADELKGIIRQKKTLLVLDNCEKIAKNTEAIQIIFAFLRTYPKLTILATSRVLLPSAKYTVDPLAVPQEKNEPMEKLQDYEAVQLFVESARRVDNQFTLTKENAPHIADVCIGLNGLPLAMLIAGSFVQIGAERLYRIVKSGEIQTLESPYLLPERQISLDALLSVSYKLLKPKEQIVLRRLSVFWGRCSIKAVAGVCNSGDLSTNEQDYITILASLSNHHLISFEEGKARISHQVIYDYATRKLLEADEAENLRIQYIDYYDTVKVERMGKYINARDDSDRQRIKNEEWEGLDMGYIFLELPPWF